MKEELLAPCRSCGEEISTTVKWSQGCPICGVSCPHSTQEEVVPKPHNHKTLHESINARLSPCRTCGKEISTNLAERAFIREVEDSASLFLCPVV